jgi:hypothetical protein
MNDTPDTSETENKPTVSRSVVFFGGALAIAAVSFVALVATKVIAPTPAVTSAPVTGLVSIESALEENDIKQAVLPVTFFDGKVDILYAGAPECSHCQAFMKDGFDELTHFAQKNGLDMVYMPMAMSAMGVAIAAVEKCALPGATVTAPEVIKLAYGAVDNIQDVAQRASQASKDGGSDEDVNAMLEASFAGLHSSISASTPFDNTCYQEEVSEASSHMTSFSKTFDLKATPSFYFSMADGTVMRSVGAPDYEALQAMTTQD